MLIWSFSKKPITTEDINRVEDFFQVKFPARFRKISLDNHGARPRPNCFNTDYREGGRIKSFLPLVRSCPGSIYEVMEWIGDRLPRGMIPFAGDEGGNYLCFYYFQTEDDPVIVLWNHEKRFEYETVSSNFVEFLDSLY